MNKYNIYVGENQYRTTELTRKETIAHYTSLIEAKVPRKDIIIYCPTRGYYVKELGCVDSFLEAFLDLNSVVGELYYEKEASLLENTLRGLKWRDSGKICFTKDNKVEYI